MLNTTDVETAPPPEAVLHSRLDAALPVLRSEVLSRPAAVIEILADHQAEIEQILKEK